MATALRKTGIDPVGDMPWGTHFCHFYETKDDLLDTLVPFFKCGLEEGEFCVWIVSEPLTEDDVWHALGRAVPGMARYMSDRSIEIFPAREWYLDGGKFDLRRVTSAWNEKLERALGQGYPGMRASRDTAWLDKKDWRDFMEYEEQLNKSITQQPMTVLCTYPLKTSGATELLDVARIHQFAIAKRQGTWEVVETPQLKQAKTEISKLNVELERRVAERTRQLEAANEELRSSEARLRQLADAIPHQVWGYREDDVLTYCNQQWVDYSGLPREDGNPVDLKSRVHPADVERAFRAREEARLQHRPYEVELRLRAADGSYRRFMSRAVPLYDERDQLVQWFGTNTDVEERRQVTEALAQAQAELAHVTRVATMGELTSSLAHELNQPLSAIVTSGSACLRWLARDQPDLRQAMKSVERVIRDANRAGEVIAHTRALLKKSGGDKSPLNLTQMIREVLPLVEQEMMRHQVVVHESLAESLPSVLGSPVELQQVVINLIMNGIEAMADVSGRPRELVITSERDELYDGPAVRVALGDAGIGVSPENLGRLFEAFYTTKSHGLGMGLPICRSIVQEHGGQLWATRNAGHGTTFQFVLPAWSPPVS
jgi:PAS domain S-box-containing protein